MRQVLRDRAGDHQPVGMFVDEMLARGRQVHGARHERDVHPCVHAQSRGVRFVDHRSQRIEGRGLPREIGRARLERGRVVRVPAAAHLHQEGVEPVVVRGFDERRDRGRRRQRCSQHPQRAHLGRRVVRRRQPRRRRPHPAENRERQRGAPRSHDGPASTHIKCLTVTVGSFECQRAVQPRRVFDSGVRRALS